MSSSAPARHKKKNKYHFKTFSERLALVNIDAVHHIRHTHSTDESDDFSKFSECLEKWRDLDLSIAYNNFKKQISGKTKNYRLVLHYREDIIAALLQHLEVKESLALPALLELTVSLCFDLSSDFYPYFSKFFSILTELLKTTDVERLESIFTAISLLFRNLWRCMVNDMAQILEMYSVLLTGEHPTHVSSFAAESISFLLRKCRDRQFVIYKLFTIAQTVKASSNAIGNVIFHIVKTSQNRFHSCTTDVLLVILSLLKQEKTDKLYLAEVYDAVAISINLMADHTRKEHAKPVWNLLINEINSNLNVNSVSYLQFLLKLFDVWCKTRHCSRLYSFSELFESLKACLNLVLPTKDGNQSCFALTICNLITTVLCGSKSDLKQQQKEELVNLIGETGTLDFTTLCSFWKSLFSCNDFRNIAQNQFLKFCQCYMQNSNNILDILEILANFVHSRQEEPSTLYELKSYIPYLLDFSALSREKGVKTAGEVLLQVVKSSNELNAVWYSLVVLQHIKPLPCGASKTISERFLQFASSCSCESSLAVMAMSLQMLYQLKKLSFIKCCFKQMSLIVKEWSHNRHALFIASILLESNETFREMVNEKITVNLVKNISSFSSDIRLLSLHILNQQNSSESIKSCIDAELLTVSLHNFRSKLLHMSKLIQYQDSGGHNDPLIKEVIVRFLLANFSINFSALWPGVQEIICTLTAPLKKDVFWKTFFEVLCDASQNAEASRWWVVGATTGIQDTVFNSFDSYVKGNWKKVNQVVNARMDFYNFRVQLWKTLAMLSNFDIVEGHNRVLAELLFDYLQKEYYIVDKSHSPLQDLSSTKKTLDKIHRRRDAVKTLDVMLSVFSRFRNPTSNVYSMELTTLYNDLLSHPDPEIQKAALSCLFTFKKKGLQNYKERLLEFFDEKKFRDTLTNFIVDDILKDERNDVITVLLRFLFGRLKSKTGSSTGGKSAPSAGRAMIIRFLANVQEHDVCMFVDLIVEPYAKLLNLSDNILKDIQCNTTQAQKTFKTVPLSRQQGILSALHSVITKLNQKLSSTYFSKLLSLLLGVVSSFNMFFDSLNSDEKKCLGKHFVAHLRVVKKAAIECLIALLNAWPRFETISLQQVDAIFNVLVTPEMNKLLHESSGHPTILLKLFDLFASNLRYRSLLVKSVSTKTENTFPTVLYAVTATLNSPKTSADVASFILEMFIHTLEEPLPEENINIKETMEQSILSSGALYNDLTPLTHVQVIDFGIAVLKPYIKYILSYFVNKLDGNKGDVALQPKYLEFLCQICQHETDKQVLSELSHVLLSHVCRVSTKQRKLFDKTLTPALSVLSKVIHESSLATKISKLFSKISERESRVLLVEVYCNACQNEPSQGWTCDIVKRLNAWNKRFVEELDFDARLTAFQDINKKLNEESYTDLFENNCLLFQPVLHSCLFTLLKYHSDISLRESVSRMLELLVSKIQHLTDTSHPLGESVYRSLIKDMLLPVIQRGLRSTDEGCRHESISLLSKLVKTFPNEPITKNLQHLSSQTDPEDDFFDNIKHIQFHRRARAFRRMIKLLTPVNNQTNLEEDKTQTNPIISHSVATRFLLPIATQTLYGTDLSKHVHLKDACLDAVKSCCAIMPWSFYKRFLLQTMRNVEKNNYAMDMICSILEVFPFNLTHFNEKELLLTSENDIVVDFPELNLNEKQEGMDDNDGDEIMEVGVDAKLEKDHPEHSGGIDIVIASKILNYMKNNFIPSLHGLLLYKEEKNNHKMSNTKADIDKCKKKIPLALALVSAIRKLPALTLRSLLPGVILKVVGYLRHKLHEVRTVASSIMVKISDLIDISYLPLILRELQSGLNRGYQKHVLTSVVYSIIISKTSTITFGELDCCIEKLLQILNEDLFGETASEKKVDKLKSKIPEARGRSKAYPAYKLLSTFVGKLSIMHVIGPIKTRLDNTHNHSIKKIAKDIFVEIQLGLLENKGLKSVDFLTLVHGILCEKMPGLFSECLAKENMSNCASKPLQPLSLLLSTEPTRYGSNPTTKTVKTNVHLLIEFSLQLLHAAIKKQTVSITLQEDLEMLDQFVGNLVKCLKSSFQQTVVDSIRCLTRLFRTNLPSLQLHQTEITNLLFKVLRDQTKGTSNQEIAAVSFKSLSVLCSTDHGSTMSETQLKMLLNYAEEDLYSIQRQSHAFELLKSILKKGLQCDEVIEVIDKVRKIAIQSHTSSSRAQARSLYLHFIINYPLTVKKLDSHIEFILAQLSYEFDDGRLSALELISLLVNSFPVKLITNHAGMIFIPTAAVLINDDSTRCKKMAAFVLKILLEQLDVNTRNQLFNLVSHWYGSDDEVQRRLAAMSVSVFAEVEKSNFQQHLDSILEKIADNIHSEMESGDEKCSHRTDHSIFYHLSSFLAILKNCDMARSYKFDDHLQRLYHSAEKLLRYDHDWVRLACCQLFGCLFASVDPGELADNPKIGGSYFRANLEERLASLSHSFIYQLKSEILSAQLAEQNIKNLIFVLRVMDKISSTRETTTHKTMITVLKQMIEITKFEQSEKPKEINKRSAVLKFCAALCMNVPKPERILKLLLEPIYRGINASATHSDNEIESINNLRALASEVLEVVKSKTDSETFTQTYLAVTKKITHKRRERKREKAVQLIADPRKAAAFKLRKQERTKFQRKRKIATIRPEYGLAKMKRESKS